MQEGKLGKGLKDFLNKVIVEKGKNKEELVVVDPKLGAFLFTMSHFSPGRLTSPFLQLAQSIKNWESRLSQTSTRSIFSVGFVVNWVLC